MMPTRSSNETEARSECDGTGAAAFALAGGFSLTASFSIFTIYRRLAKRSGGATRAATSHGSEVPTTRRPHNWEVQTHVQCCPHGRADRRHNHAGLWPSARLQRLFGVLRLQRLFQRVRLLRRL